MEMRTETVLRAYIALLDPALKEGRLTTPLRMFDAVMDAAQNPEAFAGDPRAGMKLIEAISAWEAQSSLSTPFPGPNLTWVPSGIGASRNAIVSSLIDADSKADVDSLSQFFVPSDREIASGWVGSAQDIHEILLSGEESTDRYCLLDSLNDCRITRYPSGRASQPELEMMAAAQRAGTFPNVVIADRVERYEEARSRGWHMDLARVESARILFRDAQVGRRIGTVATRLLKEHKMPTIPVRSFDRLRDICRYVEDRVESFGHGFSVWYRGQPSSYKRNNQMGLGRLEWQALLRKLKVRLHYLDDDDILIPSFYRHYGSVWENSTGVRAQFQSLAAWQLVADTMLFDGDSFPTAPDIVLANDLPKKVVALLEAAISQPPPMGVSSLVEVIQEQGRPGTFQDIEIWAHHFVMVDGEKYFLFKRTHRDAQRNATSTLLLQHYGCPTSGLDITVDPEKAAIFALGNFVYDRSGAISRGEKKSHDTGPCIYIMLLKDNRDPFLRSSAMFKGSNNDSRIERQSCGILFGSSWACRNYAQRHIAIKLELDFELPEEINPCTVYPTMKEDPLSGSIVEVFKSAHETLGKREPVDAAASSEPRFPPSFVSAW